MDPLSFYKSPPKRVILGNLNHNGNSPISPMANLKLLTKVATSHFPMEENGELISSKEDEVKSSKSCRRFRSLSFICQKFLLMYRLDIPNGQFRLISLGNLASSLGIEKRRVYDIINVVASLKMAIRLCKDKYKWMGNQNLVQHLTELKAYAIQNNIDKELEKILQRQKNVCQDESCFKNLDFPRVYMGPEKSDDNRIGVLCQKFMMMFLVNETALNLSAIAKLVLSPEQGKTGMRRLYDVANVLETLGLIKRHGKMNKKPTFVYCGPKVEPTATDSSCDAPRLRKIDSMLEIVCTELEKFDEGPKAKRRLCLDESEKIEEIPPAKDPPSFIKAPTQSFRFVCNKITQKPPEVSENNLTLNKLISLNEKKIPPKTLKISQFKGSAIVSADKKASGVVVTNKIQQPIKNLFPLNLQGSGTFFRVVKSGNVMKLIRCESVQ